MPTIHKDITIAHSPDDVWALLRDLAAVSEWVPGIASARLDGTRRICTTADGAEIHEEIELDDDRIAEIVGFADPSLFPAFGLPTDLKG
jgi:hypothetical protein